MYHRPTNDAGGVRLNDPPLGGSTTELCRLLWRQDKRGFRVLADGDCPFLRVFVMLLDIAAYRTDCDRHAGPLTGGL
jgi:hypothetical protein